jgi:hypothetical protein
MDVAEAAGAALASIAVDAAGQAALGNAGAIPLLVSALSTHVVDAAVAEHAAAALCAAAVSSANHAALAEAGGAEALLAVLGEHAAAAGVAETCCTALANLAAGASGAAAVAAAVAAAQGGAATALVRALVAHHASEPVVVRQVGSVGAQGGSIRRKGRDAAVRTLVSSRPTHPLKPVAGSTSSISS